MKDVRGQAGGEERFLRLGPKEGYMPHPEKEATEYGYPEGYHIRAWRNRCSVAETKE